MNAKTEFLSLVNRIGIEKLKCAEVRYNPIWDDVVPVIALKENFSTEDLNKFLSELDFGYDDGYGGQNLFGTIWFTDGTWADRGEYDGSEWWDYHCCPDISEYCK